MKECGFVFNSYPGEIQCHKTVDGSTWVQKTGEAKQEEKKP